MWSDAGSLLGGLLNSVASRVRAIEEKVELKILHKGGGGEYS